MKFTKSLAKISATTLLTAALAITSQAADFSKIYVDSNTFNPVVTATKDGTADPYVKVTTIYKADGSSSEYTYIRVNIKSNGKQASDSINTQITKGIITPIKLYSTYKVKGTSLTLQAMGNNSSLDCQISGVFSAN